jgi:putative PIN family toxin of toxin-antitoxin system
VPSATADTNIYISGLRFGGVPERFLDLAAAGEFRLDISDAILNETLRVLREKFQWSAERLQEAEEDIRSYTHHVTPTETLDVIKIDPSDNRILECAATAKSDYIVTGDKRHILPLGSYGVAAIVKAAEFMRQLQGEASRKR